MKIEYKEIARILSEKADFDLSEKEARAFVKEALSNTIRIVRNSKGKIQLKNCCAQQFYKPIPWDELKYTLMDLDETKSNKVKVRVY